MADVIILPNHQIPKFSPKGTIISFENHWKLFKVYNEIIGLENIAHFSINIVDPRGEMTVLSYNPGIAHSMYRDKTYVYNGSISPTYYKNYDVYTWEESHDPRFREDMVNILQKKNGIELGIVFTKKIGDFVLLYSFATKKNGKNFKENAISNKATFLCMGDHCYNLIKPIYQAYSADFEIPKTRRLELVVDNT